MSRIALKTIGSIPNHKLLKNLQLQGNYISNDGGDEGISMTDAGDITLSAAGDDVTINDGTLPIFTFNAADSTFKIIDDGDNPDDFFQIDVEAQGATTISTVDDTGENGDLTLSPDGNLIFDTTEAHIQIKRNGADYKEKNRNGDPRATKDFQKINRFCL